MSDLQEAFGEWLDSFEWSWWATLTFRKPVGPATSLTHFRRLSRALDRLLTGRVGYFVASETGGRHGREHLHALIRIPPYPGTDSRYTHEYADRHFRTEAWKWWLGNGPWTGPPDKKPKYYREGYGRALILPFERDKGATHYVTKYVTKTLAEWDIGGNLAHYVPEPETNRPAPRAAREPTRPHG